MPVVNLPMYSIDTRFAKAINIQPTRNGTEAPIMAPFLPSASMRYPPMGPPNRAPMVNSDCGNKLELVGNLKKKFLASQVLVKKNPAATGEQCFV